MSPVVDLRVTTGVQTAPKFSDIYINVGCLQPESIGSLLNGFSGSATGLNSYSD